MLEKLNGIKIALNTVSVSGRNDINTMAGVFHVLDELCMEAAEKEGAVNGTENQQG